LADKVRYIGARLTISGNLQRVHSTIHEIEISKPYLFITDATIKTAGTAMRSDRPEEPTIEARIDVFGAILLDKH
jgi:hypothetical protein